MKFRIETHWHVAAAVGDIIAYGSSSDVMNDIARMAHREGVVIIATRTETEIIARANGKPFVLAELCSDPCLEEKSRVKGRK